MKSTATCRSHLKVFEAAMKQKTTAHTDKITKTNLNTFQITFIILVSTFNLEQIISAKSNMEIKTRFMIIKPIKFLFVILTIRLE